MLKRAPLLALAAVAVVGVGPLQAQDPLNPTGTMATDPFWEVMCESEFANARCDSEWTAALRIDPIPGDWADVPLNGAYYIGAQSDGNVDANVNNELANYTYTFRTGLGLGGYTGPVQVDLDTFLLDNYWVGWSFDGDVFSDEGITPEPLGVNQNNWTTDFQLTAQGTYEDYFYLRITGNGRTDGILATGTVTVPEPGTYALLLAGLLGVAVVGLRRRTALV
jgi:hypothetical protein